ncbi:MAG: protein-L-isoaspartate(D-aspartate) O-methyltransferase [Gammaproteobacteria bacterium]|nr:protein-L-isoaspartate(D-aspartate) O-methyltransferase [Gammaproteobacteria bacterium]
MKCRSKSVAMRVLWLTCIIAWSAGHAGDRFEEERLGMVAEIEADVQLTSESLDRETLDPRVLQAMASVPRHRLVPERVLDAAYENRPLPIGHGQTISQPYIVAIMTDLLDTRPNSRVLEIGTGSGYQAAILAELVAQVYTMEIIEPLGLLARGNLDLLGYDNITVRIGDGYYGWEKHAPFDAIVVTAAASHIPPPLIKQLRPGGRMIIPVGSRFMVQQLVLVEKDLDGNVVTRQILPVRFVPLTGSH